LKASNLLANSLSSENVVLRNKLKYTEVTLKTQIIKHENSKAKFDRQKREAEVNRNMICKLQANLTSELAASKANIQIDDGLGKECHDIMESTMKAMVDLKASINEQDRGLSPKGLRITTTIRQEFETTRCAMESDWHQLMLFIGHDSAAKVVTYAERSDYA
jgi:flagellar hook-basal body complex protein FliE